MTTFLSAVLFDRTGTTSLGQLTNSFSKQFVDELNGDGSFSLSLPLEWAGAVEIGRIVKFSYGSSSDDYVFAGVIEQVRRTHTDTQDVVRISGRGVRALLEGAIIYGSDRTWTTSTVGLIMKELFDEAQVRGALGGMSVTFTNTNDSAGTAFTVDQTITIDEKLGTNLSDISNRHQELAVDVWVKPDLTLNYYIERGEDKTVGENPVVLRVGQTVKNYERTVEGPIRNALIAQYSSDSLIKNESRAGSISANGRQETFLSLTNVQEDITADKAISRTLDNLETSSVGATVEIAEDGPQPYIDFNVGDWIVVADELGVRESFRVRAVTMSEEDVAGVRIIPELGNVKAALEERLRRLIARQEAKTASGSADATAASVDLNGVGIVTGGGSTPFEEATIISYDPITGTGLVDAPAIDVDPIEFTNATGSMLFADDTVIIGLVDHDNNPATPDLYIAVGITSRAGTITPTVNPVVTVPYDFPFRTDSSLTYPVTLGANNALAIYAHDTAGLLGFGTDLIVGPNSAAGSATNAVNRGTTNSYQLSGSVGGYQYFLLNDGQLIATVPNSPTLPRVRNPNTGVWTPMFSISSASFRYVFDDSTNTFWAYAATNTGGPFFKYQAGDTAPVGLGSLGTTLTNASIVSTFLTTANGRLHLQYSSAPYRQWQKNSGDTGNFTEYGSTSGSIPASAVVGPDSKVYWWIENSTTNTLWLNTYNPTNGSVSSVDTTIIWRVSGTRVLGAGHIRPLSSGVTAFFVTAARTQLTTPGDAGWSPAVITFNGASKSIVWSDLTINMDFSGNFIISKPVLIGGTTYRFSFFSGTTTSRLWQMELTFS